jgi:hypothetical protein
MRHRHWRFIVFSCVIASGDRADRVLHRERALLLDGVFDQPL